jgi:hypothetical protein
LKKTILFAFIYVLLAITTFAQDNYWRGTKSNDWNDPQNWSLGHIPKASDTLFIVSAAKVMQMPQSVQVAGLFLKSSTLDLGGNTLTTTVKTLIQEGTIQNGKVIGRGKIASLGIANAPLIISAKLDLLIEDFTIRNTSFYDSLKVIKTGSTNQASAGGNKYYGVSYFENKGKGNLSLASQFPDSIFSAISLFSDNDSSFINLSQNAKGTYIAAPFNVKVHGGGLKFAQNNGSVTFAQNAAFLPLDSSDFINGKIYFKNVSYHPSASMTLKGDTNSQVYFQQYNYWNAAIEIECGSILSDSNHFEKSVSIVKTGSRNDVMQGGNTFNQSFSLINKGKGFWMSNTKYPSYYKGAAFFDSRSRALIYIANNAQGTRFEGPVEFKCNNGGRGFYIGQSGGNVEFTSTSSILVSQFNSGELAIKNAQINSNQAIQLSFSDSALFNLNGNNIIQSPLSIQSNSLKFYKTQFLKSVEVQKIGEKNDVSNGGNIFHDVLKITANGGGYFTMGNQLPDTFKQEVYVSTSEGSRAYFGNTSKGNYFNKNIIVSFTDSAGLYFGSSGGENVLNAFILENPTLPCSGGLIQLKNVRQNNPGDFNLTLSDSAKVLIQKGSEFFGRIQINGPSVSIDSSIFHRTVQINKLGDYNDLSNGGNIFEDSLIVWNYSNNSITLSNKYPDTVKHLVLGTYKKGTISYCQSAKNTEIQESIRILSKGGAGVLFCQGNGSVRFKEGCEFALDTFTGGRLIFRNVLFPSTMPLIQLHASDSASIYLQKGCNLEAEMDISFPNIFLDSVEFLNKLTLSKIGKGSNVWNGGNVFNKEVQLNIRNGGTIITANKYADHFKDNLYINLVEKSQMMLANTADSNIFNYPIAITIKDSSILSIGYNGGTVMFNEGSGITINSSSEKGIIRIKNVDFLTENTLEFNAFNNTSLSFTNTKFNGPLTVNASSINFYNSVFKKHAYIIKNGTNTDVWEGGNVFESNVNLINQANGNWVLSNSKFNEFRQNLDIQNLDTGKLTIAYKVPSYFKGNLDVNTDKNVFFGSGAGEFVLNGDKDQLLTCADKKLSIENISIDKTGGEVLFIDTLELGRTIQFKRGNIRVLPGDRLFFKQNAEVYFPSSASYVIGRAYKVGQGNFIFPVGLDGLYRPIAISSPRLSSDTIGVNFINKSPVTLEPYYKTDFKIEQILDCGYWEYVSNSVGNVKFQSYFNENNCKLPNLLAYTFVEHTEAGWNYLGGINQSFINDSLVFIESAYLNKKSDAIALAMGHYNIPFVYTLNYFTGDYNNAQQVELSWETQTEPGNQYYIVERSISGFNFAPIGKVLGTGNSDQTSQYKFIDSLSYIGIRYYRLKQFFADSTYTVSPLLAIKIQAPEQMKIAPNPIIDKHINITLSEPVFADTKIELYSPMGNLVYSDKLFFDESTLLISYDFDALPKHGLYLLKISDANQSTSTRVYIP